MSEEILGNRKKALEESFFAKQNQHLIDQLREKREKAAAVEALAATSHIKNTALLERLVDMGLDGATWAALSLVPLVEVAWADGEIQSKERDAILRAAADQGIQAGSESHQLLESWLSTRPDAELFASWGGYTVELVAALDAAEKRALRDAIVGKARSVADAAGGFLGLGSISDAEERVIQALEKPFA
ncbi:MAG: hypothetical protein AAF430_10910 [Myxococcota bacterium]